MRNLADKVDVQKIQRELLEEANESLYTRMEDLNLHIMCVFCVCCIMHHTNKTLIKHVDALSLQIIRENQQLRQANEASASLIKQVEERLGLQINVQSAQLHDYGLENQHLQQANEASARLVTEVEERLSQQINVQSAQLHDCELENQQLRQANEANEVQAAGHKIEVEALQDRVTKLELLVASQCAMLDALSLRMGAPPTSSRAPLLRR